MKRTDLETGVEYRVFVQALSGDGDGERRGSSTAKADEDVGSSVGRAISMGG